jgi:hypothetical protein
MTVSISTFADELTNMIKTNKVFGSERSVFSNQRARDIGEKVFEVYGSDGLFTVMRILSETVMYCEQNRTHYFTDLRELECRWNGITDDFQS